VTTLHLPPVTDGWSLADTDELPGDQRYEVHNGSLVIMSPARIWHQRVARRIANLLEAAGRVADTEVGVRRTARDGRVADVAALVHEPDDSSVTWHPADQVALVAEVWSRSSEEKDRFPDWYARLGIPEYWLVEPIEGSKWGALITMYELARTPSGTTAYVEVRRVTLDELSRTGLA
jgi:Uma2 family endonuclease